MTSETLKISVTWALPSEILINLVWVGTHKSILPKNSSTFQLAPVVSIFHHSAALMASKPTVSGPSGDLGMLVEEGAKGDNSFGKAEHAAIHFMLEQMDSYLDHLHREEPPPPCLPPGAA